MTAADDSLEASVPRTPWYRFRLDGVIGATFCLAALATTFACAGRFAWLPDIAGSFRPQYLLVTLVALILYAIRKKRLPACAALVVLVINTAGILPRFFGGDPPCEAGGIKLFSANVFTANDNHQALLDLIERDDPDAVLLMEVNPRWIEKLAPLRERYPHHLEQPRTDNFGIAFYTRLPLDELRMAELGAAAVPSILARVASHGQIWHIIGTHPVPPVSEQYWTWRNEQFADIATLSHDLQAAGQPVLVIGDLNAAPWSAHFRQLCKEGQLRDSAAGFGLNITWPTNSPLFSLPIDHCLVSDGIRVCDRRNRPEIGSDHYPIVVDITLPARP
jgi:endonuclease/exonuclease/phosphatase (EEP) superfamily protein YafD